MVGVKRFTDEELKERDKARRKSYREANREKIQAYTKQWRATNSEHVKAYAKSSHAKEASLDDYQQRYWEKNLKAFYKMTITEFNELWVAQDGKCAICKASMSPRGRAKDAVAVDHNHKTGAVRGLLCRGCNHGIGCLKDSPDVLRAACSYLEERGNYSNHEPITKE